ncbi:hypothetical protein [Lapillicoccus jejuensis]|uniref:Lipase (Class 3) n=1 Tax=Lapillicoccus jejuensis TaxID=402171 RepID=A0A542E3L6_9MICO|nr:hypothetical protein [Lapillicoccus jejuensis]TQJ09931.1 hypothetical protein FB458_3047 [Lapillicoccus jejuensis]
MEVIEATDEGRAGGATYGACDRTVELRIHGVSGTPPEELLDRPLVVQVGGDATAGFHRPRLAAEDRDDRPAVLEEGTGRRVAAGPGPRLEAYCWGGLTSGAPSRALWLYLLPFTLVNVAARARTDHGRPGLVRLHWWGARLLALALTGLYVVTSVGVGVALTAHPERLTGPLATAAPGTLLALGAVVPLVHVLGLWLVSRRTFDHYEVVRARVVTPQGDRVPCAPRTAGYERHLDTHDMWFNAVEVTRLRAVHVQTGLALVAATLLWSSPWVAVPATVVAQATARALLPAGAEHAVRPGVARASLRAPWVLVAGALGGGVVRVLEAGPAQLDAAWGPAGDAAFRWLTVAVLVGVLAGLALLWVSAVTGRLAGWGPRGGAGRMAPQAPACAGLAAPVAATLATFVGGAFAGGLYLYGASYVATGSWTASVGSLQHVAGSGAVPPAVAVGAVAFLLGLALVVVLGLVGVVVAAAVVSGVARGRWAAEPGRRAAAALADDYPETPDAPLDPVRLRQVRRAIVVGGLVDHAPALVGALATGGLLVTVVAAGLVVADPALPGGTSVSALQAWGGWLAVRTLVLLIGLGALAFRVPATRRKLGILWDVASFWPRTAHPLAAPCYAERTLPDLATRVSWLLSDEQGRLVGDRPQVVLAGHSQGSVIAAATVLHLHTLLDADRHPDRLEGLRLLTFGCVVRRLYGRWFPVYFGPRVLDRVADALAEERSDGERVRWVNLWRWTDYLGGQVSDGPPCVLPCGVRGPVDGVRVGPAPYEWHAPDPTFARPAGMTTYGAPRAHSGFTDDPSGLFQAAVRALAVGDLPRRAWPVTSPPPGGQPWHSFPDAGQYGPNGVETVPVAVSRASST